MKYIKKLSTGELLGSQSGDAPTNPNDLNNMTDIGLGQGLLESEFEVGYCTIAELKVMRDLTIPPETWEDKRLKSLADGGYGTITEQLEMIGEQGEVAFQAHIQTVKTNHPKPV